ncbi:hypothetical protein Bca4012_100459 [Brassica carinata]
MQPPSLQSSDIHRKPTTSSARIREKARPKLHLGAQNHRESIGQRDQKRRSRTDSGSNQRRSRRKDGAIRATAFLGTKAGETGAVRATVFRKRKTV